MKDKKEDNMKRKENEQQESSDLLFPLAILSCPELTTLERSNMIDIFDSSSVQFKEKFIKISGPFSELLSHPEGITKEKLSDELKISIGTLNKDIKIMKEMGAQIDQELLIEKLNLALSNLGEKKCKDNNSGGGLFCRDRECRALLYPDPDKEGWHKCKKCGKSFEIRGKRIIVISRAKPYKERKIEEGRQ